MATLIIGLFLPLSSVLAITPNLSDKEVVIDAIRHYAERFEIDPEVMTEVVRCESNFRVDAVGDKGKAYGPAQFWKGTFDMFSKEMGVHDYDYKNPLNQLEVMAFAFSRGYHSHWTCFSKMYGKTFVRS